MSFAWPVLLWTLLLVPLLLAGYVWAMRRRNRRAVTYSNVALLRVAAPRRAGWKRHARCARRTPTSRSSTRDC